MSEIFASPWIPTIATLLLACGARFLSRSWRAPGPFALLVWGVYLVVPLALAPEYRAPAIGVWLILLLLMCVAIGADLGTGGNTAAGPCVPSGLLYWKGMLRLGVLLSLVGLAGALYWAGTAVTNYGLDFSVGGLFSLGHLLSVERYGGEQPPFLVRALIVWIFPAALLGGMSFAVAKKRRDRMLCFLPLVSALILSIIQATRANTLIAVVLGTGGYIAVKATLGGVGYRPVNRKTLLSLGGVMAAGWLFFISMDALRSHKQQDEEIEVDSDWARVKFSTIGYLAVFGHWVNDSEGQGTFHLGLGAYTFGGLLEVAGLHPRETGLYTKSVSLEGDDSNIYTAFRGLIEDFSLPGAMAFCLLIGFLSGQAYRKSSLPGQGVWVLALAAFYVFLLWSPIVSIFLYNGPILAILLGAFALRRGIERMQPLSSQVHDRLSTV